MRFTSKNLRQLLLALATAALPLAVTAQDVQVVHPTNTVWIYNDSSISTDNPTIAAGTFWNSPTYVPVIGNEVNQWKTGGRGLFGNDTSTVYTNFFGTAGNGFRTPLNRAIGADAAGRYTFYFITKFNWPHSPTGVILRGTNWLDDGGIVYLNGVEVFRARQPGTPGTIPGWSEFAGNQAAEGVAEPLEYAATSLVTGENTLAVEVHQSGNASSDLAFSTSLRAVVPFPPVISTPNEPADRTVVQNRSTTLAVTGDGSPRPTYQWYHDNVQIPNATNASYTITRMQSTDAGLYKVTLINEFGTNTSRSANVGFTADTVAPTVVRVVGSAGQNTVVVEFDEVLDPVTGNDGFNFDVLDASDVSLFVESAVLQPNGTSVILTLTTPTTPDTIYRAHVEGVNDLAGLNVATTDMNFRSWAATDCAGVLFEAFDTVVVVNGVTNAVSSSIPELLSHPNYPNRPRDTFRLNSFSSKGGYTDDLHDNFGGRLRALFIPPTSGNWVFYISSDDASRLFLNPTGPGASGKILVQEETGCCGLYSGHPTAPYPLVAGNAYYLEAIYKEGTGGDNCHVWAGPEGVAPPTTVNASLTAAEAIPGSMLGIPGAPVGVAGTFTITQQPASQTTVPNTPITFNVATSTDALLCYQWMRGGVEIPNAVGPQYSLVTTPADNGAVFSVRISILGGNTITSADAILTVLPDVILPTALSASSSPGGESVVVTFSEPITAATAGDAGNYSLNGQPPASVTVNSPTVVTLVPATLIQDCVHNVLIVTGMIDTSGNVMNPPSTINFTKVPKFIVANSETQIWRFEDTGADLGTGWKEPGFDDSGWVSAPGPLAFEDATTMPPGWPIRTQITNYVPARITMYFRTKFNLATDPRSITRLELNRVVDDGAIFWVNGKLLDNLRVDTNSTYSTLANAGAPAENPHPIESIDVPTSDLVYGENVLAVEVHQNGTASSDIVLGTELVATIAACIPPLTITRSGNNVILNWPDASFRLEKSADLNGGWSPQAGASGVSIPATGNLFFRLVSP